MRFAIKEGVSLAYLDKRLEQALPVIVAAWYRAIPDIRMTITSGRDGEHSANSLHYEGRALDLRVWGLSDGDRARACIELRQALGNGWDVIDEKNHIHLELDRRAGK